MCMKGNLLLFVTNYGEYHEGKNPYEAPGDSLPADIPKLLELWLCMR